MGKPIFCIDFDGVLHHYVTSGPWDPTIIRDGPTPGAEEALREYLTYFDVQVFSSRSHQDGGIFAMRDWCQNNFGALALDLSFPKVKPPAMIGLDDRVLTFTGEWPSLDALVGFRPWNKK